MKIYLTVLLFVFSQALFAQNKGTITGTVQDVEEVALEKATISVLNQQDSSLISYTLTDDKGKFKLYKLPLHKDITLIISYVGTSSYSKVFNLISEEEYELGIITLETNVLEEVYITSQPPVSFNKDTLEYNANYFKTRPDASVEELMKKLPGLQVNMDGSIYYQGKEVSKVLVNDKEFFAQDLRIATRNLDASMVDVVQVYRDKGDSKQEVEDETTLPITINLKFKKELARADFGKFYAGGGSRDRYESGILLNTFRDTLQVSFIGFGNNINRQSFDYSELSQHAGLGRAENYGFQDFGGRSYSGLQNDVSGGVNVNYDWGKITKLSLMYQYTYGDVLNESNGETETFYDSDIQNTLYGRTSTRKVYKNAISGRFNHKFDTTAFLRYRPNLTFNKSKNESSQMSATQNLIDAINENNNTSNGNNQDLNYRHDFILEKAFTPKIILSLNNNLNYSSNDRSSFDHQLNTIFTESADPSSRFVELDNETANFNNKVNSNLQLKLHKNFNVNLFVDYDYLNFLRNEEFALAIDDKSMVDQKDNENNLHFITRDYAVGTRLSWTVIKNLTVQAGVKGNYKHNTFDYLNVLPTRQDNAMYWLPSFNIRYKALTINYSKVVAHPQFFVIRSVDNTMNAMGVSRAFPYAQNMITDNVNVNINKYFSKTRTQLNIYGNYRKTSYSFGYKDTRNLTTGRYENEYYIAPGTPNFNLNVNYSRMFKLSNKLDLRVNQRLHSYTYESYGIQNNIENKNSSLTGGSNHELTFTWKGLIAISPKYDFNIRKNLVSSDDPIFKSSTTSSHSISAGVNIMNVSDFSLETSYSVTAHAGGFKSNPTMNIVNISLYYDIKKKGQLKLSVFDLLNQNIDFYNSSYNNSHNYSESITLKQYFLLGYIYKFNRAKMK